MRPLIVSTEGKKSSCCSDAVARWPLSAFFSLIFCLSSLGEKGGLLGGHLLSETSKSFCCTSYAEIFPRYKRVIIWICCPWYLEEQTVVRVAVYLPLSCWANPEEVCFVPSGLLRRNPVHSYSLEVFFHSWSLMLTSDREFLLSVTSASAYFSDHPQGGFRFLF